MLFYISVIYIWIKFSAFSLTFHWIVCQLVVQQIAFDASSKATAGSHLPPYSWPKKQCSKKFYNIVKKQYSKQWEIKLLSSRHWNLIKLSKRSLPQNEISTSIHEEICKLSTYFKTDNWCYKLTVTVFILTFCLCVSRHIDVCPIGH